MNFVGQKRFRKQVKRQEMFKKLKFNNRKDKIQAISKVIEDLKEKLDQIRDLKERKARISESVNNKAMHKAKQLSLIEKLEYEIQCMELRAEKINKKKLELEVKEKNVEKKNKKAKELCDSAKTAVEKLAKVIAEAQLEVVHSPEEYLSRLDEIEKQYKLKADECSMMREVIQERKQSLKQMEETLNFVQKMKDDLRILGDAYKELKDKKTELSNVLKEIDTLNDILKESKTKLAIHNDPVDELRSDHAENMVHLTNIYSQLLSEEIIQQAKLDPSLERYNEKCSRRDRLQAEIEKIKEENIAIVNSFPRDF